MTFQVQQNETLECNDVALTYEVLSTCLGKKREEAAASAKLADTVQEEYENSLSYRIGSVVCPSSR